jgi:hypothetical protein
MAPRDLDEMTADDLVFWAERAREWFEWQQKSSP